MSHLIAITQNKDLRQQLEGSLAHLNPKVSSLIEAVQTLLDTTFEVVLVDAAIGAESFDVLMTQVEAVNPQATTIALVTPENRELASPFMKRGAQQYLLLPLNSGELELIIQRAQASQRTSEDKIWLWSTLKSTSDKLRFTEREMEQKVHAISRLYNVGKVVDLSYVLRELLQMIVQTVCEQLSCASCSIILLDKDQNDQVIQSKRIRSDEFKTQSQQRRRGTVTQEVVALNEPVLVEDITRDVRFKGDKPLEDRPYKTPSFISAPMRVNGHVLAIINASDRVDRRSFTPEDLETLIHISGRIVRALTANVHPETDMENFEMLLLGGHSMKRIEQERDELSSYLKTMAAALEQTRMDLEKKLSEISVLYNVGKVLKATFAIEELLKMIVDMVTQSMKCKRCSILLMDERGEDLLVKGVIGIEESNVENVRLRERGVVTKEILKLNESILAVDADNTDMERFFVSEEEKGYRTRSFLSVPIKIQEEIVAIINVTDKISGDDCNEDDLRLLEMLAGQASIAIENFRLSEQLVEKERMDRELQIAYSIQVKLLPERMPDMHNASLYAHSIPAARVGGDYFDFFQIDERRWGMAIGDIAGKGVPAALLMVLMRSLLRAKAMDTLSSAEVVGTVNRMILPDIDPMMFATLFYGIYDTSKRELCFTNAGHNYPFWISPGRNEIRELSTDNLIVGMFEDYAYDEERITLSPDDMIVFYTDGISEAMNNDDEMYGSKRLYELARQLHGESSKEVVHKVFASVFAFAGSRAQYDDMTLMVLKTR